MTVSPLQGITHACFGLSYLAAFLLELARLFWPARGWRVASLAFGAAGFIAQCIYIVIHEPSPASPYGSLVWLTFVLAIFYLWGTVHHAKLAWGVFVLPVILILIGLSFILLHADESSPTLNALGWASGERFWAILHGFLILAAAVGVSVSFVFSVMFLIQSRRLRRKMLPGQRVQLFSLERLETKNRLAVNITVPFLTAGLLVGTMLIQHNHELSENWFSLKIISTTGLWVVFLVLLYMRYGTKVPPRRLAMLSILAFVLMLVALGTAHPFVEGGVR